MIAICPEAVQVQKHSRTFRIWTQAVFMLMNKGTAPSNLIDIIMKQILFAVFMLMASFGHAEWTPPEKPDPQTILQEASADAKAQRYADALAKHVWIHENSLKYDSGFYGVRLSFALSAWAELGAAYPPALAKLKSFRDDAGRIIREGDGSHETFHDFAAINKTLNDESQTKELFIWLDSNKSGLARKVFDLAEPSLIKAKEYRLCGSHIEADASFQEILRRYRQLTQLAQNPLHGTKLREHAEKSFSNGTSTLVALLVLNGRSADAERISSGAIKVWDNPQFKKQLEKAKHGDVPEPWP